MTVLAQPEPQSLDVDVSTPSVESSALQTVHKITVFVVWDISKHSHRSGDHGPRVSSAWSRTTAITVLLGAYHEVPGRRPLSTELRFRPPVLQQGEVPRTPNKEDATLRRTTRKRCGTWSCCRWYQHKVYTLRSTKTKEETNTKSNRFLKNTF